MKYIKKLQKKAILFLLFILCHTIGYAQSHSLHNSTNVEDDFTQELIKSVGKELKIIENKGQIKNDVDGSVASDVLYTIPVPTGDIFITRGGLRIQHINYLRNQGKDRMQQLKYRFELELVDCNPTAEIVTTGKSIFYRNYYFSASDYIKNVHDFESVKFINIYPNIDWVVYVVEGKLKYDFIVKPGGNPEDIQLLVRNGDANRLNQSGELVIETPLNTYKESRPMSFQNGTLINTQFSIDRDVISFILDEYDQSKSLRIDPELKWGTMISNKQNYVGNSAVLDITENKNSGNVKLVGYNEIDQLSSVSKLSSSPSASTTSPNTYVMHLDSGRSPKWALYFPGTSTETSLINNCELNSKNELILSGVTSKSGLSKGSNVYQNTYSDSMDFFIAKLDSSGTLDWLTYYGGPGAEMLPHITSLNGQNTYFAVRTDLENNPDYLKVNSTDEIVLFGQTSSSSNMANSSNPILNYQGVSNGNVIAKFKSSDGSIIWSSYLYGRYNSDYSSPTYERLVQLLIDHADNIYVLGETQSDSVVFKADNENVSDISLIVMKIDNSGVYKWGRFLNPGKGKFMYVNGATVSVDNKLLIVGSTNNDTFNIQGRREGAGSGKGYDGYLMQLDTSMDIEWYILSNPSAH